jgi:hypothetical protein
LPAETKLDRPSPRRSASASSATPDAPDWLEEADPAGVRQHQGEGGVEAYPRLGVGDTQAVQPDHPHPGGVRGADQGPRRPSGPASANPAEMTTSPYPGAGRVATTDTAASGGTATTARSTARPASAADGHCGSPATVARPAHRHDRR